MNARAIILAVAAALATLMCDKLPDQPSTPSTESRAGQLHVVLSTPQSNDGVIVFELHGPAFGAVTAADTAFRVFTDAPNATTRRVVVAGDLEDGRVLSFDVQDVGTVDAYDATILEVASRTNAVRSSLNGFGLTIER